MTSDAERGEHDDAQHARQREEMVARQIERRGVKDVRVLAAMREVPRHVFMPEHLQRQAYSDQALPIGEGQTISQPYIVAAMLECLALQGTEMVLDIGAGSGYQTALLSLLALEVIGLERVASLAEGASERLARLGYSNARIIVADGTEGLPEEAPYDAIVVGAGSPEVPQPLAEQLATGGRLCIPVGDRYLQRMTTVTKCEDGTVQQTDGMGCVFVPLLGKHGW